MAFGSEVSDEGEVLVGTQVSRKPRRMLWVGLAGVIAMCAMGFLAKSRFERRTPLDHVARFGGLMRAFTKRALKDDGSDFSVKSSFTFKEVGADDPSTTGVKMLLKEDPDAADDAPPVLKVIWLAKEGKGADLLSRFSDAKDNFLDVMTEEHGKEEVDPMKEMLSIEQVPDADQVLVSLKTPPMPMEEDLEQDMEEGPPPELSAEIFIGRSIKDMFESRDEVPIPKLPNGVKMSGSMKVATAMMSEAHEMDCPIDDETEAIFGGLASASFDAEVLYKAEDDLADKWDMLDSREAWGLAIAAVQSLPASVTDKMAGVDELADGIHSITMANLPYKRKLEVMFTNFKIAEVLKALLEAPRPKSLWG